ncbi:ribonuclease P protein component [Rhodovulum strictum]|uniref:Ribonuclease P protein component n=1 Tax=Rhodovulum strictum TaxID=58314 RepID=A0A844BIW6_9RHOB|nr:ribonuclease P protein component [Rhodovulum strictum]MRH20913.1 ribonuclease P protein component [Rhodovulum strictum]
MRPPGANVAGETPGSTETPAAASLCPKVLCKRVDFLRAARALRQSAPGFILQARERAEGEAEAERIRVGFTCSKKVGNAVARNRAKRRLREIARLVLPAHGREGWDYVLVGRPEITATRDFAAMQADLKRALAKVHGRAR